MTIQIIEDTLIDMGFAVREAKIYASLFQKTKATAGDIQQMVGIPRTKVYEIMTKLISKGLCSESIVSGTHYYELIDPELSWLKITQDYQQELLTVEKKTKSLLKLIMPLYTQNKDKDTNLEFIEILQNNEMIMLTMDQFQRNAQKELLIFSKSPYAIIEHDDLLAQREILEPKAISMRVIIEYNTAVFPYDTLVRMVRNVTLPNQEVKIHPKLPMKLLIVDEDTVMLSLNDFDKMENSMTAIKVMHAQFAKALKYTFEGYWNEAYTLDEFIQEYGPQDL